MESKIGLNVRFLGLRNDFPVSVLGEPVRHDAVITGERFQAVHGKRAQLNRAGGPRKGCHRRLQHRIGRHPRRRWLDGAYVDANVPARPEGVQVQALAVRAGHRMDTSASAAVHGRERGGQSETCGRVKPGAERPAEDRCHRHPKDRSKVRARMRNDQALRQQGDESALRLDCARDVDRL